MYKNFLDKNTIRQRWLQEIAKNNKKDYFIYIDNPFCLDFCSFCIYSPTLIKDWYNDIKDKYYNSILLNEIDFYGEILQNISVKAVYFWWWTSSIMSVAQMENIFSHLQKYFDFRNAPIEKTFELNPILLSEEKIETLKKWNFTNVTMGIQSFNKDILTFNNRVNLPLKRMKYFMEIFQKYNFQINMDLMVFIYKGDILFDLKALQSDIKIALTEFSLTRLTIFPNYHKIFDKNRNYDARNIKNILKQNFLKISLLRKMLSKIDFENYDKDFPEEKITPENSKLNYYFTKKWDFKELIYNCTGWTKIDSKWLKNQNLIAIWWYWKRRPYSYIWDEFCYHNIFENWQMNYSLFFDKNL